MGESNLQNIVPFQTKAPKRSRPLAQMSEKQLLDLATPEAQEELELRWGYERFGVDESE